MSGTFRSVVRPNKVLITTDSAGVLSFAGRATSFIFSSGQSAPLSSVSNTEHLIDSQLIEIYNQGSSDILIAPALMTNGIGVDIEPQTVQILLWSASTNKFVDVGGTAATKNLEVDYLAIKAAYLAHAHTGTDASKIKATDLDPQGGSPTDFLILDSFGNPVWHDPLTGTSEQFAQVRNTDISTNLNNVSPTVIPITGTPDKIDSNYFTVSGNGIEISNYSGWLEITADLSFETSNGDTALGIKIGKNGTAQPGESTTSTLPNSGTTSVIGATLHRGINVTAGDTITLIANRIGVPGITTMRGASCVLSLRIPSSALARGPQGLQGNPNWSFLSGYGVPSNGLGVNQDLYLDKNSSNLYKKISGVWTLELNIQGETGPEGSSRGLIWAEKIGTLSNNSEDWSYGGSSGSGAGRGIIQMTSGMVTHLGLECRTAGASSISVELLINGVSTGQSITLAPSVNKDIVALGSNITFGPADIISFRTVLGGSAANARVSALIVYDGEVVPPEGYVIPTDWKHSILLNNTHLTNGYIDLPHLVLPYTVTAFMNRLAIHQNQDYTLAEANGVTRVTFINDIATGGAESLEVNDTLYFSYRY